MRKITKNTEPKAWTQYRLTPGAAFKPIPELVNSLLDEQGYICAYCERRIPCKDAVEGTPGAETIGLSTSALKVRQRKRVSVPTLTIPTWLFVALEISPVMVPRIIIATKRKVMSI